MWVDRIIILFRVYLRDIEWIRYDYLWNAALEFGLYTEEEKDFFDLDLEYNEDDGRVEHEQRNEGEPWYLRLNRNVA